MTDKPIKHTGMQFICEGPEGERITLKYLMDAYARLAARSSSDWRPFCSPEWESLCAKMRRDATISVIRAKCGVR